MAILPSDDREITELLHALASQEPQAAWNRFLIIYSPLIVQVVRLFEREPDLAGDCFVFACEQLHRENFHRLRRFQPGGEASFNTWLRVVVRNLCLDWHRRESGRPQMFQSIARLQTLDQSIFQAIYRRGLSKQDCLLLLRPHHPDLSLARIEDSIGRIEQALTPRQRWLLQARRPPPAPAGRESMDDAEPPSDLIPDPAPGPEAAFALKEEHAALGQALSRLSVSERLLLQLRFDQELTLLEIARVMDLKDAQTADRRIREILEKLRKHFSPKHAEKRAGHPC